MSLLDSITGLFDRDRVKLTAESKLIIPGQTARAVICYRCDRELGPDHDEERCARKGTTRRFFLGGLAATAVGIAAGAEVGLFGEKTKAVLGAVKKITPPEDFKTVATLGPGQELIVDGIGKIFIGMSPVGDVARGYLVPDRAGKPIYLGEGSRVHSIHNEAGERLKFRVIDREEKKATEGGILIQAAHA